MIFRAFGKLANQRSLGAFVLRGADERVDGNVIALAVGSDAGARLSCAQLAVASPRALLAVVGAEPLG